MTLSTSSSGLGAQRTDAAAPARGASAATPAEHLRLLREKADRVYASVLPNDGPYALVDFPNHSNCGDSAIWLGERAMLRQHRVSLVYTCAVETYCERVLRTAMPRGGTVLLHGGGNFGSLWPNHHELRLGVLERLRDYKVVQLPQSLHFGSDDQAMFDRTAQLIAAHPDFTLLARDRNSLALGERLGARTLLCPDSAHYLQLVRPAAPQTDCFVLARTDKESRLPLSEGLGTSLGHSVERADWLEEPPMPKRLSRFEMQFFRGAFRRPRAFHRLFQPLALRYFDALAWQRVDRGVAMLGRGHVVLTDRLHAHILSSLLEIPNVVLDNSYGKIHDYIRSWMSDHPLCHPVSDAEQALGLVKSLLAPDAARPAVRATPA